MDIGVRQLMWKNGQTDMELTMTAFPENFVVEISSHISIAAAVAAVRAAIRVYSRIGV